jgi:lipopolysaccharide/colanic/teichoic acid biosynthesis glycosyltransferase
MPRPSTHADRPYRGKRAFDLAVLAVLAAPAGLIGAACAVAIKLTDRGSVFFRQERVGYRGRPFRVVKFRTMRENHGATSMFPDAALITPIGRRLRRLSLDELPQLVNVARGEMSIVGPRPTLAYQVERYTDEQRRRLSVRPGLTGLAQVKGRNSLDWAARIRLDIEYLERQSPWFDARILCGTVMTVMQGSGVEGHPADDPLAAPPAEPAEAASGTPGPGDPPGPS